MKTEVKTNKILHYLVWECDGDLFAAQTHECREVELNARLIRVPYADSHVRGIVSLRGEMVTVLEVRELLGKNVPSDVQYSGVIRLRMDGADVAIAATSVHDIVKVTESERQELPPSFNETERKYLSGVIPAAGGVARILRLEAL